MRFPAFSVALFALCAAAACSKPKAGDACKPGQGACVDRASALACVGTAYVAVPCRGPAGCGAPDGGTSGEPRCDDTLALAGDPCAMEGSGACTPDRKALLSCKAGSFAKVQRCLGAGGCATAGDRITCDVGVAAEGDGCMSADNHACTADHQSMLVCRGGKFVHALYCHGELGCRALADRVDCDDSIAETGDACEQSIDMACASDGRSLLACRDHTFAVARTCKTACVVKGREVLCD